MSRYTLYADGAARGNPGPAGSGAALISPEGEVIEVMRFLGHNTNNVAEYTALIIGLEEALKRGVDSLDVRMDSKLVVEQVSNRWKVRTPHILPLQQRARELMRLFRNVDIRHIPREQNGVADELSNRAIDERVA